MSLETHLFSMGGRSLLTITPCKLNTSSSLWVASEVGIVNLQYAGLSFSTGTSSST